MTSDDPVLPGEEVLFEGTPRGRAPFGASVALSYGALASIGLLFLLAGWLTVRGAPVRSWSFGPGAVELRGVDPAARSTVAASVPNPLAFLVLVLLLELHRQAAWRSRRVLATATRVLVVDGVLRRRTRARRRRGGERVIVQPGGVLVEGLEGGELVLEGLDEVDASGLSKALETFDVARPVPATAPPFWDARRARRVALVLALVLLVAAVLHAAPWRTTVVAESTVGPAGSTLSVVVDAPERGSRRLARDGALKVETLVADGTTLIADGKWVGPALRVGSGGGGSRGLLRSRFSWELGPLPPGFRTFRISGTIRPQDGAPAAFEVAVAAGERAELVLGR